MVSMSYIGTITAKGIVTLFPEADFPTGTRVEVTPLMPPVQEQGVPGQSPTLLEMFADFVGVCDGPSDLAANHDHYARGVPRR